MTTPTRLALAAGLLAVAAGAPAADLVTLSGKKLKGELVAVDPQVVTFTDDATGTAARVPVKELALVDLGHKVATPAGTRDEVELTDATVLQVAKLGIKGKAVAVEFLPGPGGVPVPTAELPLDNLFSVLRGADDPKNREAWAKLVAGRGKRDLFVIRQGGELNPLPGTLLEGNEAGDRVTFELETGGTRPLPLSRASGGLVFNQPPRAVIPPTVCKVRDVFGNVLYAQAVELSESAVRVKTVSGGLFTYPDRKAIAKLDFAEGNVAYLSDLEPKVSAPPADPGDPAFSVLKDRHPDGGPLRLDGVAYDKGLWLFPETVLTYSLNGDYREFKAVVGIDERVPVAAGAVKVTVEGDGRMLFRGEIGRKDKAKPLTLDVKGVKELTISVDRDGLYLGDQLNLADARVQK